MVAACENMALKPVMVASSADEAELVPDLGQRWLTHLSQVQKDWWNSLFINLLFLLLLMLLLPLA